MTIPDIPEGWRYVIVACVGLFGSVIGGSIAYFTSVQNNQFQLKKSK